MLNFPLTDIDNSNIEIPIAMELLKDPVLTSLVDEFFFELHFECELLSDCCWGHVKNEVAGFKMDRLTTFKFFQDLRFAGIRAHFWP